MWVVFTKRRLDIQWAAALHTRILLAEVSLHDTRPLLLSHSEFPSVNRGGLDTLQVNLGYRCNLSCTHCHVGAGPKRTEMMADREVDTVLEVLEQLEVRTLDLTGGAPEMHPRFRDLVQRARELGVQVIDRCNLTILLEPGYESLPEFLRDHRVEVVASLPCYEEENVDRQRGRGVYGASIEALHILNRLGYGKPDTGLVLNLVYNPVGANLPPPQAELEAAYRAELERQWGIEFNSLFTLANMPISRFGSVLLAKNQYHQYMSLLRDSFRAENLDTLMCRSLVSVDWRGHLYDCDFNQMLRLPLTAPGRSPTTLQTLLGEPLDDNPIATGQHCFGCTAGQGSSCGGALAEV